MENTIEWLLQGDPAVRWQVYKDLLNDPYYKTEQLKTEQQGWCKKLVDCQSADGTWANSLYSPKWTSTHYTLLLLKRLGLPQHNKQALKACNILLKKGLRPNGSISFWKNYPDGETCVTAMSLTMFCYFQLTGLHLEYIFSHLKGQQMPDGGWNCQYPRKATHASFHTTLLVLESLYEYEKLYPEQIPGIRKIQSRAHGFLLKHRLFKSHKTGEIVSNRMTRLSYPTHWYYHIHTALDYFQKINHPYDPRFCDAIDLLKHKQKNNRWPLQQNHPGKIWFELEKAGQPSRINTLIALRILNWWNNYNQ